MTHRQSYFRWGSGNSGGGGTVTVTPDPNAVASVDRIPGIDANTGDQIIQEIIVTVGGARTVNHYEPDGVTLVTGSPSFSVATPAASVESTIVYDTDTATGAIVEARQDRPYTLENGVITWGTTTYRDAAGAADYTPVGTIAAKPIRVQTGEEDIAIAAAGTATLTAPANSAYAEISVAVGANVIWSVDGNAPSATNGEAENGGSTIRLYGADSIANFQAIVADATGVPDAAGTADLSVVYSNVSPEADAI